MNRLLLALTALLCLAPELYAQSSSADWNPQSHNTSAIDFKGIRYNGNAYKGTPPWIADRIAGPGADYPLEDRRMHHQGAAILRLILDLKTGRVVKVSLLKSTGYATLDRCAIAAFSRWIWRPGKWKEIDVSVTFRMGDASQPPPRGAIRLPRL
jgi:TonB family protein